MEFKTDPTEEEIREREEAVTDLIHTLLPFCQGKDLGIIQQASANILAMSLILMTETREEAKETAKEFGEKLVEHGIDAVWDTAMVIRSHMEAGQLKRGELRRHS